MSIKPLGDYVFLRMNKKEQPSQGIILVTGQEEIEFTVESGGGLKKGTVVTCSKQQPSERVTIDGQEYIVIDKKYIFCTL